MRRTMMESAVPVAILMMVQKRTEQRAVVGSTPQRTVVWALPSTAKWLIMLQNSKIITGIRMVYVSVLVPE
jgi:hypothetical protein